MIWHLILTVVRWLLSHAMLLSSPFLLMVCLFSQCSKHLYKIYLDPSVLPFHVHRWNQAVFLLLLKVDETKTPSAFLFRINGKKVWFIIIF